MGGKCSQQHINSFLGFEAHSIIPVIVVLLCMVLFLQVILTTLTVLWYRVLPSQHWYLMIQGGSYCWKTEVMGLGDCTLQGVTALGKMKSVPVQDRPLLESCVHLCAWAYEQLHKRVS